MKHLVFAAILGLFAAPLAQAHPGAPGYRGGPYLVRGYGWSAGWNSAWSASDWHAYYGYRSAHRVLRASVYPSSGYQYLERSNLNRGDYRATGTLLGAIAGAVIGNNSGSLRNSAGLGAVYGAGVGYVLGSVAEAQAVREERSVSADRAGPPTAYESYRAAAPVITSASASPAPSGFDASAASPMAAANGLFGR